MLLPATAGRVETNLVRGPKRRPVLDFIFSHPLVAGFIVLLLGFVLFMYLFVRRTLTGFREGVEKGRR